MVTNKQQPKEDPRRLLEHLRNCLKQGDPQARADVQRYLRMSRKAEELREQGWQTTVRGERQRWFVVIEGKQPVRKPWLSTPRVPLRKFNAQRRACFVVITKHTSRAPVLVFSVFIGHQIVPMSSPATSAYRRAPRRPSPR
jgi:hypothetical protein